MGQKIIKNRIFKNTWYNHSNQSDWKIAGIKTATFSGTPGNWGHLYFELLENSRPSGLLFSGELLETGGIHNSSYWKIAGLAACYFQGNSRNWGIHNLGHWKIANSWKIQ